SRRRKTKCDGVKPRCRHCSTKQVPCDWGDEEQPRARSAYTPTPTVSPLPASESPAPAATFCFQYFYERHLATDFCSFLYRPDFEASYTESPFLVASILALCIRYVDEEEVQTHLGWSSPREASRQYASAARAMARQASDQPSVVNIQAHLVLALSELLSDSGSSHWMYSGTAIRMAQVMRLNKEYQQEHTLKEREMRRRTFWACLLFDRLIAYLLSKPRTISVLNVGIPLPCTDMSLIYQEPTHGITLDHIVSFSQRPSEIGLIPYFIKTVVLWSDVADIRVCRWRFLDILPPTNPSSRFARHHSAVSSWAEALPPGLQWTPQNYALHRDLGQGRPFVAMHFLLHGALCVAYQMYIPQTDSLSVLHDTVDAAGWSMLHREPEFISATVINALAIGEKVSFLMSQDTQGQGQGQSVLQSVWVLSAVLSAANTLFWLKYAGDISPIVDDSAKIRAGTYIDLFMSLFASWTPQWSAAKLWIATLTELAGAYRQAYLGSVNEDETEGNEDLSAGGSGQITPPDREAEGQYRPKPGDGLPPVTEASPLSLHASMGLNVADRPAQASRPHNPPPIWFQLASAGPTVTDGTYDGEAFTMALHLADMH
ncbi:hypothetical protein GQ53DRAFT_860181, partial [Thozetella sp. PMI_491]